MSIVARGLGLPRRGSIVAVGLGLALSTSPPVTIYPTDEVAAVVSTDSYGADVSRTVTSALSLDFATWAVVTNLDGTALVTAAPTNALVADLRASSEASAPESTALVSRQETSSVVEDRGAT